MKNNLYLVDAFTNRPFAGNPAVVCLLLALADPTWMPAGELKTT
jgi:predicted PhzF superfamily epimerase YddE/YHI9